MDEDNGAILYADNVPILIDKEENIKEYIDGDPYIFDQDDQKTLKEQLKDLERDERNWFLIAWFVIAILIGICIAMLYFVT